jgi:hypothetical protein
MKRITERLLCAWLLCMAGSLGCTVQAQSFGSLWKQLEQAEKKSLPKSVIQLADRIYAKAESEQNAGQLLKAYIVRSAAQESLTPDSFYIRLQRLEAWAAKETKPVNRAVLHSLLAGEYADYAASNRWQLNQRTDLDVAELPADLREWSGNLFLQQVRRHIVEALKDTTILLHTSSKEYEPFVVIGESSNYYRHDLYHLLASRAVESLQKISAVDEATRLQGEMLTVYRRMKEREDAVLLCTLDSLAGSSKPEALPLLNDLIARYGDRDVCAEVYLAKANFYWNSERAKALQVCDEALARYPKYRRINALRQLRERILQPIFSMNTPVQAYPGDSLRFRVSHLNLDGFSVQLKQNNRPLASYRYALQRSPEYVSTDTTFTLPLPDVTGTFTLKFVPDGKVKEPMEPASVVLTRLQAITKGWGKDSYEVIIVDSKSGHPVPGATVSFFTSRDTLLATHTTDVGGVIALKWSKRMLYLRASKDDDTLMPPMRLTFYGNQFSKRTEQNKVQLLTDRTIYRPGQTVYVKGISFTEQGDTANVLPNRTYVLRLTDVNRNEVASREVRTNEFGSFATEIALPTASLNGTYTLSLQNGYATIQVEEYKRPSFELTFDKISRAYHLGDTLQITGKATSFSGVPLEGDSLKYTIERRLTMWYRPNLSEPVASSKVEIGADGHFSFPLPLTINAEDSLLLARDLEETFYLYQLTADVTNRAGETQTQTTALRAGLNSMYLYTRLSDKLCKDEDIRTTFFAENYTVEKVDVKGTYRLMQGDKQILSAPFTANVSQTMEAWRLLPSGKYELLLTATDDRGVKSTAKQEVTLFSYYDHRPATHTDLWCYVKQERFDATHPAEFSFGTSLKDVYVMMDLFAGDIRKDRTTFQLTDSVVQVKLPYKEEYGDGVQCLFSFVKEGQLYTQSVKLSKQQPERDLQVKWEVFRDKLRPGQSEEWKLTLQMPNGTPAAAELLASMYDASLDKFVGNDQSIYVNYWRNIPNVNVWSFRAGYKWSAASFPSRQWNIPSFAFDHFYGTSYSALLNTPRLMIRGSATRSNVMMAKNHDEVVFEEEVADAGNDMLSEVVVVKGVTSNEEVSSEEYSENTTVDAAALRTNFAETAFFYPQLRTNKRGEVVFSFTVPESLTRWNFRGYAHTRGMWTGLLEGSTVTAKEFMLQPNLPRFVRVGDQSTIAATISNQTAKAVKGTARMELFDPMTEKVIATQRRSFTVEGSKSIGVSFKLTATDKYDLLGVRLIADGGTFSDGEQHLLPVLSNKTYLTETLALPLRGNEQRTWSLDTLFNRHSTTATERRLTVEVTSNPAWLAVQALPVLDTPKSDDAIAWATSLYANSLAAYIVQSQPRIKTVLEAWKAAGNADAFRSKLEQNEELKDLLLSETPWLVEATTDTERMSRLLNLFDTNRMNNSTFTALTHLQALQNADGSWSWYKGMSGSIGTTASVLELMTRLTVMTGQPLPTDAQAMREKAFGYLHNHQQTLYKEGGSQWKSLPAASLEYLYLVALAGEEVPASARKAYTYFSSLLPATLTSTSMCDKALAAVTLLKTGKQALAGDFIASLKEHLIQTDERGAYFAFNETPYLRGMLPVTIHTRVMEALRLVDGNDSLLTEMQIWLLKQKQNTAWSSPVATADAVYALLTGGSNLLSSREAVQVSLDGKPLSLKPLVPELGYAKQTFGEGTPQVKARRITLAKQDDGIAYGAVYAQYLSPIADVNALGGALAVEKQLYVERTSADGKKSLQPLANGTSLTVGDRVISRLTIRLDRAMDYVQLKDARSACLEPETSLSGYRWGNGIGYYVDVKDAATHFFFDTLSKGVYVLESSSRVARSGRYLDGVATLQSAYAPEYAAHSAAQILEVK